MSALSTVIGRILSREGSTFTNEPTDAGGPTKYGITQPFYLDVTGKQPSVADIKALTEDKAKVLYLDWMTRHRLDEIDDLGVLDTVVDFAVHSGVTPAVKALQRALDVPQDGRIGIVTLTALREADPQTVMRWVTGQRLRRLGNVLALPSQHLYARGWLSRVASVLEGS